MLGDGVAERTKATVTRGTLAGSNFGHGWRHFSPGMAETYAGA